MRRSRRLPKLVCVVVAALIGVPPLRSYADITAAQSLIAVAPPETGHLRMGPETSRDPA